MVLPHRRAAMKLFFHKSLLVQITTKTIVAPSATATALKNSRDSARSATVVFANSGKRASSAARSRMSSEGTILFDYAGLRLNNKISNNMNSLKDFTDKEKDMMELIELTGIIVNPRILRNILQLLQANVTPASVAQLLNELAVTRTQEKIKRHKIQKSSEEKLSN